MKKPLRNVDLNSAVHSDRRDLASRIIRKRFLQKETPDHIYRDEMGKYTECDFLNNDTLVAFDSQSCFLDLVKLTSGAENNANNEDNKPVGNLRTRYISSCHLSPGMTTTFGGIGAMHCSFALKGFGSSFAVGLPTGNLHIFDTEYETSARTRTPESEPSRPSWFVPATQQAALSDIAIATRGHQMNTCVTKGWIARRPLMRYRYFGSLRELVEDPTLLASNMFELANWDRPSMAVDGHFGYIYPIKWDFRKLSGSSLLALHTELRMGHFSVTLADTRQKFSQNAICFDADEQKQSGLGFDEARFLSDNLVISNSAGSSSKVSIWDLRRTKEPMSEIVLPSFPKDVPFGLQRSEGLDCKHLVKRLIPLSDGQFLMQLIKTPSTSKYEYTDFVSVDVARLNTASTVSRFERTAHFLCSASPASNLLAIYEKHQQMSFHSIDSCQRNPFSAGSKRKRTIPSTDTDTDDSLAMPVRVTDQWGLSSSLRTIAFNRDGTCIAGASEDGDLFSWSV